MQAVVVTMHVFIELDLEDFRVLPFFNVVAVYLILYWFANIFDEKLY